ncbi:hypothetical protein Tco_1464815 [Tanacetum coccineum]
MMGAARSVDFVAIKARLGGGKQENWTSYRTPQCPFEASLHDLRQATGDTLFSLDPKGTESVIPAEYGLMPSRDTFVKSLTGFKIWIYWIERLRDEVRAANRNGGEACAQSWDLGNLMSVIEASETEHTARLLIENWSFQVGCGTSPILKLHKFKC